MFTLNPTNDLFNHPDNEIYAINADGTELTLVVGGSGYRYIVDRRSMRTGSLMRSATAGVSSFEPLGPKTA